MKLGFWIVPIVLLVLWAVLHAGRSVNRHAFDLRRRRYRPQWVVQQFVRAATSASIVVFLAYSSAHLNKQWSVRPVANTLLLVGIPLLCAVDYLLLDRDDRTKRRPLKRLALFATSMMPALLAFLYASAVTVVVHDDGRLGAQVVAATAFLFVVGEGWTRFVQPSATRWQTDRYFVIRDHPLGSEARGIEVVAVVETEDSAREFVRRETHHTSAADRVGWIVAEDVRFHLARHLAADYWDDVDRAQNQRLLKWIRTHSLGRVEPEAHGVSGARGFSPPHRHGRDRSRRQNSPS